MPWHLTILLGRASLFRRVLPDNVAVFCTTSDFPGFLDGGSADRVRGVVRERFGFDARLATCQQVHGAEVVPVAGDSRDAWREMPGCDALVTAAPGIALGIKIADCLPVTLVDPARGTAANVHSGWRGAAARIVPRAIDRLADGGKFDPSAALAFLGPSIRVCCFEVGEEVVGRLAEAYGDVTPFVDRGLGAKPHVDLAALTKAMLVGSGLAEARSSTPGFARAATAPRSTRSAATAPGRAEHRGGRVAPGVSGSCSAGPLVAGLADVQLFRRIISAASTGRRAGSTCA